MDGDDITRFVFLRALAFIYFIAFLNIVNQFRSLVGDHGLLPAKNFMQKVSWKRFPSLFYLYSSDRIYLLAGWLGVILAFLEILAIPDQYGYIPYVATWVLLWVLYLSFTNIGQDFYWFGWESMLLETGFLAIFLGPLDVKTPVIVLWLVRWVLFRNMFGAGLIKLRGDPCWRKLTCLYEYFETQPIPNPLSIYFHWLPKTILRGGVLFNHFAEIIVPWFYFFPHPISDIAGLITILFQVSLIISGNLSFLNYLTIVQCIACFSGSWLVFLVPMTLPVTHDIGTLHFIFVGLLSGLVIFLSIRPVMNLISPHQVMNTSFDPLHLVNTYGAFGSISTKRFEIILEGSDDSMNWKEYEFKAKPGDISRCPPIISPYHLRLDWLMWFAAMRDYRYYPWILHMIWKLLHNEKGMLGLMRHNPFPEHPPQFIRARLFLYEFVGANEKTKNFWKRQPVGEYLPVLSKTTPSFLELLKLHKWI